MTEKELKKMLRPGVRFKRKGGIKYTVTDVKVTIGKSGTGLVDIGYQVDDLSGEVHWYIPLHRLVEEINLGFIEFVEGNS